MEIIFHNAYPFPYICFALNLVKIGLFVLEKKFLKCTNDNRLRMLTAGYQQEYVKYLYLLISILQQSVEVFVGYIASV